MKRSPTPWLSRGLALVVLLASLVAVPGLTSPASADGANYTGTLKAGQQIVPVAGTKSFDIGVFADASCSSLLFYFRDQSPSGFTIPDQLQSRYLKVQTAPSESAPVTTSGCDGPVLPNAPYTGTLKVGSTLTAAAGRTFVGVYGYSNATCTSYQGTSGQLSGSTYVLSRQFAGQYVNVGTKTGDGQTEYSACAGPVAAGTFDAFTSATYTGDLTAGGTLTAVRPTGVPQDAQVTYAWKVSDKQGTTTRSTTDTFTSTPADAGKVVVLEATAASAGFTTKTVKSQEAKIQPRPFDEEALDGLSLVDSTPLTALVPGDTVSFDEGEGTFPEGTTFTVRFGTPNRFQPTDCDVFEDTLETYEVSPDEVGKKVCARVTVEAEGYATTNLTLSTETVQGVFSDAEVGFDVAPQVDVTSTVKLAGLDPQADGVSYVWTVGGEQVSDEATYTPAPADAGSTVEVAVTVTRPNYQSRTFTASAIVAKGVLTNLDASISGAAQVGSRLTAGLGADEAREGSTVSYDWGVQLPGESACESIGVTARSFVLPKSAKGSKVCVTVTVEADGYETYTTTSPLTATVTGLDPQVWLPSIDDTTPTFGDTVTASVDERDLPGDAEVAYQWGRQVDGRCVPVEGASGATYLVGVDDVDQRLCVRSTVSAFGYEDGSATSRPTAAVEKASMGEVSASLDETTPTVGDTVTASWTGAGVPEGATATYRFETVDPRTPACEPFTICVGPPVACRDTRCDQATRRALGDSGAEREVTPRDVGLRLRATVTLSQPGYEDAVATTDLTDPVAKAVFTGADVAIEGTPTVDGGFSADVTEPEQEADEVSTVWTLGDEEVPADAVLTPADAGKPLTVTVTFARDGYETAVVSDVATVAKATFDGTGVELDATPTVDTPVTATVEQPEQEPDTTTVVWTVDDEVVEAAADGSYTPSAADAGRTLAVTVTYARAGYEDVVVSDAATVARATFTGGSVALSADTAQVGRAIEATTPTTPARASGPATLVWTVDGVTVAQGVSSYRPRAVDAGKRLEVAATWSRAGYEDRTVTAAVAKVAPAAKGVVVDRPSVRRGESFTVTATGLRPGQLVDVRLGGKKVGIGRTDVYGSVTRTVTFPSSARTGRNIEVRVTAFVRSKNRYVVDTRVSTSITLTR